MKERIVVTTQEELNEVPVDFKGIVEVAFGTEETPAIIDRESPYTVFKAKGGTVVMTIGRYNSGYFNRGYDNIGDHNRGDYNSGVYNRGWHNSGDRNSGKYNAGDYNAGDYNTASYVVGCFNTESQKLKFFDQATDMTFEEWRKSEAWSILARMPFNCVIWVPSDDMAEEEKGAHPEHTITGGFLRKCDCADACNKCWEELSENEREIIRSIPNFDAQKFYAITGIRV